MVPENSIKVQKTDKSQEKSLNKDKFRVSERREADRHLEHVGVVLGRHLWAEDFPSSLPSLPSRPLPSPLPPYPLSLTHIHTHTRTHAQSLAL